MTKSELRTYIKDKLREYSTSGLEALSLPVINRVLEHPRVKEADTILLYYSLPSEVCTHSLINILYSQGKRILLPKVVSDTEMTIHEYQGPDTLSPGAYGIQEPNTVPLPVPVPVDVIIIPGLAFDKAGNRLGRGKGYYDRILKTFTSHPYKIALCFPFQIVDSIPHKTHDVPVDEIIWQ